MVNINSTDQTLYSEHFRSKFSKLLRVSQGIFYAIIIDRDENTGIERKIETWTDWLINRYKETEIDR